MKNVTSEPTAEERELLETLTRYPALETAFEHNSLAGFSEIKRKMQVTLTHLERVIRRGDASESNRAAIALTAYQTTINFLNELEKIGKNQPR